MTFVSTSRRFDIFSSLETICGVLLESVINVSISYLLVEPYVINNFSSITSSVTLSFWPLYSCDNPFLCDWSFSIITFLAAFFYILVGPLLFFLDYSTTVFLNVSNFVGVLVFLHVLALCMSTVF